MDEFRIAPDSTAKGDDHSTEAFLALVYDELRRFAHSRMALESANHTLQPTALVHEAWLKMVKEEDRTWHDRSYFISIAATAMRRVLVDHSRQKNRMKRGGGQQRLDVDLGTLAESMPDEKIVLVDDALEQLGKRHPLWARIVEMKYFGGMLNKEVAETLNISERSVERYWASARAWLYKNIQQRD